MQKIVIYIVVLTIVKTVTTVLVTCLLLTMRIIIYILEQAIAIKRYVVYKQRGAITARNCNKKQKHINDCDSLMSGEQPNEVKNSVNKELPHDDGKDCEILMSGEQPNEVKNSVNEELPHEEGKDCEILMSGEQPNEVKNSVNEELPHGDSNDLETLMSGELPNEVMNNVQENHNIIRIDEKECKTLASGGEYNKIMNGEKENKLFTDGQYCKDNNEPNAVDVSSNSQPCDWGQVDGKGCSYAWEHVPNAVEQKAYDNPQNGPFLDERGQDGEKEIHTPICQKIFEKPLYKVESRKPSDKGKDQVAIKHVTDVSTYPKWCGNSSYAVFPVSRSPHAHPERMNHEKYRFSTFKNYEGNGNCLCLAKNGFYHDHGNGPSYTVCYCCRSEYLDWQRYSNIEQGHRVLNPRCLFVNEASDNVPWFQDNGRNGTIVDGDIGGLWHYRESTVIGNGPVVDLRQNIVWLGRRGQRPNLMSDPNRRSDWTDQYGVNNRPVEAVNATVVQPTRDVPVSSFGRQIEMLSVGGNSNRRQEWTNHDVMDPPVPIEPQTTTCQLCKKQPGRAVCRHLTVCEECQTAGVTCSKC